MSEIESMQRYIERTAISSNRYEMNMNEVFALSHMAADESISAVIMAFNYGRAKCYRAAKAEHRKGASA